ncbi:type II toxin-antitoxin system HicB family antitoxin [Mycolicibacterium moriokaense]|nr:type II toxin-antitoxin system HicB family antitoxin [Mycolicibacterium moriokaense]
MKTDRHYTYRVEWSPEDSEFVGLVAEFPSLSWLGPSPVDAMAGIVEVVEQVVADMEACGEPLPEPLADRRYSGKIALRTSPDQHRKLAIEAAEQGVSVNQWINQKLAVSVSVARPSPPEAKAVLPVVIDVPETILPTTAAAPQEISDRVAQTWRVLREAFTQGVEVPGDRFLPGGLAPTGAQVMPNGTVMVFSEDDEGRRPAFIVPNVRVQRSPLVELS